MNQVNIGLRIKRMRLQQRRTQQEIADFCGFTKSHLSKIETGKVMASIGVLAKISESLNTKISILLNEENHKEVFIDRQDEVESQLQKTSKGYSVYPFAAGKDDKKMQPFYFVTRKEDHILHTTTHEGEEFFYIIEGEMILKIGTNEYHLKEGDGFYFDTRYEHQTIPLSEVVRVLDIFSCV